MACLVIWARSASTLTVVPVSAPVPALNWNIVKGLK
jgi:hypothetical protein